MAQQLIEKIEEQLNRFEQSVDLPIKDETGEQMYFIRDGILNVSEYLKSPIKILWILKEAHSDDNSLSDMRPNLISLSDNENPDNIDPLWGPTWRTVANVTYGIFEKKNMKDIPNMNGNAPEVLKHMHRIAHINVKKYAGGSIAVDSELSRFYKTYKELLHEQIEIINPDVMIFGGTFGLFSEYFEAKEKIAEWLPVYKYKEKLLIDTYHPANRKDKVEYCDYIINAVREWRQRKNI